MAEYLYDDDCWLPALSMTPLTHPSQWLVDAMKRAGVMRSGKVLYVELPYHRGHPGEKDEVI